LNLPAIFSFFSPSSFLETGVNQVSPHTHIASSRSLPGSLDHSLLTKIFLRANAHTCVSCNVLISIANAYHEKNLSSRRTFYIQN
jgi:hypothetical protein